MDNGVVSGVGSGMDTGVDNGVGSGMDCVVGSGVGSRMDGGVQWTEEWRVVWTDRVH